MVSEPGDLPTFPLPPINMPDLAFHFTDGQVHANPWTPIADNETRASRRAYRAAVV